jgi:hypothetical protein
MAKAEAALAHHKGPTCSWLLHLHGAALPRPVPDPAAQRHDHLHLKVHRPLWGDGPSEARPRIQQRPPGGSRSRQRGEHRWPQTAAQVSRRWTAEPGHGRRVRGLPSSWPAAKERDH